MDYADWPSLIDTMSGLFNIPIPALTATMWWAEMRHYETDRVEAALYGVARKHESPFLPPLGVILKAIREDGRGTPLAVLPPAARRFIRSTPDQFLLAEGGSSTHEEGENDDGYFARGLICGTPDCGYTPILASATQCPLCGGAFVSDGYVLAQGQSGAAA